MKLEFAKATDSLKKKLTEVKKEMKNSFKRRALEVLSNRSNTWKREFQLLETR